MSEAIALRKLSTFRRQVREKGIVWIARASVEKAAVWALSKRYAFRASWHPPTVTRPYRQSIADAINALQPQIVCEVGCGLGSILARLKAPTRIGYDIEHGVIRAAQLIRDKSIEFRVGTIKDVTVPQMDVLILVNWIHEVSEKDLSRDVLPLLERTKYLVVDAIEPGAEGYTYKHDFAFLNGRASETTRFELPGEPRTFRIYKVD